MTKNQLLQKRLRRKRAERAIRVAIPLAAAFVIFLIVYSILNRKVVQKPVVVPRTQEAVETDTATIVAASETLAGNPGWNVSDSGWWYLNDDMSTFTNGWKTVDGQRYYFDEQGYMATGWVNTGNVKDSYFDASGILDTSKQQKLVALTYDDGPSSHTADVLDAMEKYGFKCTFFIVGQMAENWTDQVKRAADLGMELASHSYTHPWLNQLSEDEIEAEMDKNDQVIRDLTGITPTLMRPTGGGVSENMLNTITKPMIQWDVDTLDWSTQDDDQTYQTIIDNVQDGSIVLMHDLYHPAGNIADKLLGTLKDMGYKCVTVSELAEAYGYELNPADQYFAMYPEGCIYNKTKEQALAKYQ